jgi:hypothetical protein
MSRFVYTFEELPLVVNGDVEAGLINGEATIDYDRAGLWEVVFITLDGYKHGVPVQLAAPLAIETMVMERLHGSWHDKVQDAVREQLEFDREVAADDAADMKLSERRLDL